MRKKRTTVLLCIVGALVEVWIIILLLLWLKPDFLGGKDDTSVSENSEGIETEETAAQSEISEDILLQAEEENIEDTYYRFIRDQLLPSKGYADLSVHEFTYNYNINYDRTSNTSSYTAGFEQRCQDQRSGLVSADIVDLNLDETPDLLVYYFAKDTSTDWSLSGREGVYASGVYADLYTMSESGEIYLVGTQLLFSAHNAGANYLDMGMMEVGGRPYLYAEGFQNVYFTNAISGPVYTWYEFGDDGVFAPKWQIKQTDGGSSGIAISLLTRLGGEEYQKDVLWADGEFCAEYPGTPVAASYGESQDAGIRRGFAMIGSPEASTHVFVDGSCPSYIYEDCLDMSFNYSCFGEDTGQDHVKSMRTDAWDRRLLQSKIAGLEY